MRRPFCSRSVPRGALPRLVLPRMLLVLALSPSLASADDELLYADLRYEVPRDAPCPTEQNFKDMVLARVGYDAFAEGSARRLDVRVSVDEQRYRAELIFSDTKGFSRSRTFLPTASCEELIRTLAIATSVALDPYESARLKTTADGPPSHVQQPPRSAQEPESTKPSLAPLMSTPPTSTSEHIGPPSVTLALMFGPAFATELLPTPLMGPQFGVALSFGAREATHLSARLIAQALLPLGDHQTPTGQRFSSLLATLSPQLCAQPPWLTLCANARFGSAVHRGTVAGASEADETFFASVGLRGGARLPLAQSFEAEIAAEVLVPMTQTQVRIEGQSVWQAPTFGLALGVMLVWMP